jgi:hypothetical protein
VSFAEWNAGTDSTVDTRLRYRKSLDSFFFNELDGSVWRSPDGRTRQTLRLGFQEALGDAGANAPLTIAGEAIFEAAQSSALSSVDSRKAAVETRVAGLLSPFMATDNALSFRVEKTIGARPERARILGYDQSWTLSSLTQLGLNMRVQSRTFGAANNVEPSIQFNWRTRL